MIIGGFMNTIDIIVPCFNEEEVLPLFIKEVNEVISEIRKYHFKYIFIDDGSKDKTLAIIKEFALNSQDVKYISFSRNFGKEAAMYAGLKNSTADYAIVMDADLQPPPKMFHEMIKAIEEGFDCCALYRTKRKGESVFRRFFSKIFFSFQKRISHIDMPEGAVDYRIMTKKMENAVLKLAEGQRFSKGIFCWVGFNTKWIEYKNIERPIGKAKWSLMGLCKYAIDGIMSFSVFPLRIIAITGFIISLFSFIYIMVTIIQTLIFGIVVPGYVTTLCATLFLGGIIELSVGVLGEYIGRIYIEVKHRPIYIAAETNIEVENK